MIAYILKDVGTLSTLLPVMKKAWRTGDNNLMFDSSLAPLKGGLPGSLRHHHGQSQPSLATGH